MNLYCIKQCFVLGGCDVLKLTGAHRKKTGSLLYQTGSLVLVQDHPTETNDVVSSSICIKTWNKTRGRHEDFL